MLLTVCIFKVCGWDGGQRVTHLSAVIIDYLPYEIPGGIRQGLPSAPPVDNTTVVKVSDKMTCSVSFESLVSDSYLPTYEETMAAKCLSTTETVSDLLLKATTSSTSCWSV